MRQRSGTGLLLAAALALLAACRTRPADEGEPDPSGEEPSAAPPWTRAFQEEAALVADEIRIEGPHDLLDHVAIRQDPELIEYHTRTTTEGLLQELSVRPGVGRVEIRAQLDAWALAAFRRLVVLQRPGEVPVSVRASGDAAWFSATGTERRESTLAFQGRRGQ